MTILFYEYSRYSGDALYEQFADEILESIMELPDDLSLDLSDGLCGIGWGITYLLRERFITGEIKDVLSDIDIKIQETEILNDDTLKDYHTYKSRKTKRDGCEKRNAFIETKTKCASNLIRKVTVYLQNQSKTPSLYIKINGIQMDF